MSIGIEKFWDSIRTEDEMLLATAADGRVTMRTVSPVYYQDKVLIFTSPSSTKYRQLKENPSCCFKIGIFFAEAEAEFSGHTMLDSNSSLRKAYEIKFSNAFNANVENNGVNAEFILLKPRHIKGWSADENNPENTEGLPFDYKLD